MSIFNVGLKKIVDDSYDISIGYELFDELLYDIKAGLLGNVKKIAIVTDDIVKKLYADSLCEMLEKDGFLVKLIAILHGEKSKTRQTKEMIEDTMLDAGFRRDCAVIAIGGGVVTDIAGFVAGTFGRGVPFVNYATTLLAAADASVGGKTAVDTPLATNLIGLFNQPRKVYIDIATWKTLPQREISCGLSETIKHAIISNREFFDYLKENIDMVFENDKAVCSHISDENCKVKYQVVMKDEKESGLREVLNLGHTVGRAIETLSDYRLLHGEALSIGLVAQAMLSNELGFCTKKDIDEVVELLKKAKLPTEIPEYIDKEELVKKLYTDKKVKNGKLRFVLQKGIGDVAVFGENEYAKQIDEKVISGIIQKMPSACESHA